MSTSETCDAQRARLDALGLYTETVATRRDVDTFEDARVVAMETPDSRFATAVASVDAVARAAG
jgi:hypothetical protein